MGYSLLMSKVSFFLAITLILLSCLAIYAQTVSHPFSALDDPNYISANRWVRAGITVSGLRWAFTTGHFFNWHPLTWMSHMIDVQFFGLKSGPAHLVNLAWHAACASLLFLLLWRLSGSVWRAFIVAEFFAVHPLHVESVAWLSERKDMLSLFFCLLAVLLHHWDLQRPSYLRRASGWTAFACSLMSKPMLVTLPILLLVFDFWPLGRYPFKNGPAPGAGSSFWARLVKEKIPYLLMAAASSIVTLSVQTKALSSRPPSERICNAAWSYLEYLFKMAWPARLAPFYPHPGSELAFWKPAVAALFLAAVTAAAVIQARRRPYFGAGWLWYLVAMVPVIGVVQVGNQAMADRYTYWPLTGMFVIIAWGGVDSLNGRKEQTLRGVLIFFLIVIFAAMSWKQTGLWQDPIKLFNHALKVTKKNYLAADVIGGILVTQGKMDEGKRYFEISLQFNPKHFRAHYNMAVVLDASGRPNEAYSHYVEAIALKSDYSEAYTNLGALLHRAGRYAEAEDLYRRALRLDPLDEIAQANLGMVLEAGGRREEAATEYRRALEINPSQSHIRRRLDGLLRKSPPDDPGRP